MKYDSVDDGMILCKRKLMRARVFRHYCVGSIWCADAEDDEDGEVLQMKVLSAAEDDDVYTVCC